MKWEEDEKKSGVEMQKGNQNISYYRNIVFMPPKRHFSFDIEEKLIYFTYKQDVMYSIENKSEESRAIQNNAGKHVSTAQFKDNRSQNKKEKGMTAQLEKKENLTGMPDDLKEGIESLSGFSMDDVRVHYNSSKPATVQALAYTQGTDIHVAPGQEKHLPHEAWHVAQQMAGRVSPTTNINGMPVNDNAGLEHEADVMGEKAIQCKKMDITCCALVNHSTSKNAVQRKFNDPYPHIDKDIESYKTTVNKEEGSRSVPEEIEYKFPYSFPSAADIEKKGKLPSIAFEVMASVERKDQLISLYNNVIKEYNGIAYVYMGINAKSSKPETDPAQKKRVSEEAFKVYEKLKNEVNPNHRITVIPFIFRPTYTPKEGEKGGYDCPYMEARHMLMTCATFPKVDVYRWIDSDVEDDTSIDAINTKGEDEFEFYGCGMPVVYSGFYNWRGGKPEDNVGAINKHEAFFRKFFWYSKGFLGEKHLYEKEKTSGYIPEPIAYMNDSAHDEAKKQLEIAFKKVECQQNEAEAAFEKFSMVFKPGFSVSKPVKDDYLVSAPKQELAELRKVRQSAFDRWIWNSNEKLDSSTKEKVLALSKRLNGLLSDYNAKLKKGSEDILLSAIFNDIIGDTDKTIKEIEIFLKWKKEVEGDCYKIKWIDDSKYIKTTIGGIWVSSSYEVCSHLIAEDPPSKFFL